MSALLTLALSSQLTVVATSGADARQTCAAAPQGQTKVGAEIGPETPGTAQSKNDSAEPAAAPVGVPGLPGECVDQTLQEELLARRKYRLTSKRMFVKSLRHELTLTGGYYVSDLFDSSFTLGGAYTFFMSENFGSELSVSWSRLRTTTANNLEESNNFALRLGETDDMIRVFGSLLWSPLYGKVRLIAGSIWRYDLYFAAGPGVIVDPVSYGAAGNFGLGVRLFLSEAVALRFELRDYLYTQELLSREYLVNDLAFTVGLSLFVPPRN
jgi:outer membrane beta-barrel protein